MLKVLKGISVECMECLNKDEQKKEEKYDNFCTCTGGDDKITTSAKLLDVMYESYGFTAYLTESIN